VLWLVAVIQQKIAFVFYDLLPREFFYWRGRMLPYISICSILHKWKRSSVKWISWPWFQGVCVLLPSFALMNPRKTQLPVDENLREVPNNAPTVNF